MNVLLIAQCDKRALVESRRILDQFAERRGERTWQTPITQAGLDTLRKLLKKTARRNTAVACHWIRGRDHSELLWIVGDASRFNEQGAVPTNSTHRDVLRKDDENDWHSGEDIKLLSALSALLHDLGKSSQAFQDRLKPGAPMARNLYRHEWTSLRLFQAFIGTDDDAGWLARLANPGEADDASWLLRLQRDGLDEQCDKPFAKLPPLAKALAWLVMSHHRLPQMPDEGGRLGGKLGTFQVGMLASLPATIDASWNEHCSTSDNALVEPYWQFPHGLPVTTERWRERAAKLAKRLLALIEKRGAFDWLGSPYVLHLSRLSLMLADHHYSSLTDAGRVKGEPGFTLWANTDRKTGKPCQALDEHLLGVEANAALVAHRLADFERSLPRLTRHKGLKKRSRDERFRWQDKAFDLATGMREHAARHGAFIVNMASTGCGKTLANARIMYALSDAERGMRCAFALGLRSLTLQTGRAFRDRLRLDEDDLAIRVGGSASRELFDHYQQEAERTGSASTQALLDEEGHVRFDGNVDAHPLLNRVIHEPAVRALLVAPLLVCTIDHLTPATESRRGGRQIAPMLRLMSGDLVLDEPDDFDIADLPALTRLVHWAGLLGSRVLLSSATLPPALIKGLFEAYRAGRTEFQRHRGERPGVQPSIACAWVDEHRQVRLDCADPATFSDAHGDFAKRRYGWLATQAVRRLAAITPLSFSSPRQDEIRSEFAGYILSAALRLHAAHAGRTLHDGKRVSFGLVRMANIEPLFDVALALFRLGAPQGIRIHLCVYHSQFPLLLRSAIERQLDETLQRHEPDAVFEHTQIRQRLARFDEPDQLFIVLGSPVTEVGRDHDYDWAVVEPSSMRSLIQLAGRVRRHRPEPCLTPNVLVFDSNLRHFEQPDRPAFCRPGFENERPWRLTSHRLSKLLELEQFQHLDARPRILERSVQCFSQNGNLADLEHARLNDWMLAKPGPTQPLSPREQRRQSAHNRELNAHDSWSHNALHLTAIAQQQQPLRLDTQPRVDLALLPNEDGEDYRLTRIDPGPRQYESLYVPVDVSQNQRIADEELEGPGITPWGETDYMQALIALAEELEMPLERCAKRFGTVSLPDNDRGWRFHPALGFAKRR
ncbi:type I-F CRISPR-associated helicase Cas3f [Pseudomonas sp. LRF_L74]|uniref:type I-F CRISPR-associated helicase Cas3f n=1 Tax=Pseudomonas sp. LRF_L74 TaxID=3369422 RepID=UPI003F61C480